MRGAEIVEAEWGKVSPVGEEGEIGLGEGHEQLVVPLGELGGLGLDGGLFGWGGDFAFVTFRNKFEMTHGLGAPKNSCESVIIAGGDGVEFVVVTAGATDRESEKGTTHGVDLFIDQVHEELRFILFGEDFGAENEKAGSDPAIRNRGWTEPLGGEEVTGELFGQKVVEWLVGVEGSDYPVAVAPSVGHDLIFVLSVGVGVAGDIEPPAAPAFTVAGRSEEAVDHLGEGIWGVVFEKLGDFCGSGWEASEIVGRSSNEGSSIGWGRHF